MKCYSLLLSLKTSPKFINFILEYFLKKFSFPFQGVTASKKKLKKCFGTNNEEQVIRVILEEGEMQVSDLEREEQFERLGERF